MKKIIFSVCFLTIILLLGCAGNMTTDATSIETRTPVQQFEPTLLPSLPTENGTATTVVTSIAETRLSSQCLDVTTSPDETVSDGLVILASRTMVGDVYKPDVFLINMATKQASQIAVQNERQINHVVSRDKQFLAYKSIISDASNKIIKAELVIVNALGERLKVVPWEEEWLEMPTWLDNERLIISLLLNPEDNSGKKPLSMLVLNPFGGERRILEPEFPRFLDTSSTILPRWEGWYGVVYNNTLTRAIYPHFVGKDEEIFTYAVWDLSQQRFVTSLENVFSAFSAFNDTYPMPVWSPDGSKFVFQGAVKTTSNPVKFELYGVSLNGQVEQLTQLTSAAYIWESSYSWSPDGRYIAMFIGPPLGAAFEKARVAVLDTLTSNVIDYCVPVTFVGEGYGGQPSLPVWSPDSQQFLVTDWYEKNHRRVILVDIKKNIATQIMEDMEPVGWMIAP